MTNVTHKVITSDRMISAREEKLNLFETSVGWEFTIIGMDSFKDYVTGIDRKFEHVCSEKHGNFHVDLCQLTGHRK